MRGAPFLNLVLAVALIVMAGWIMVVGKAIVLPILLAIIAVYVLKTAAEALGRLPLLGRLPTVLRHGMVLLGFTLTVLVLGLVVSVTLTQLVQVTPQYQANLEILAAKIAHLGGMESYPSWDDMVALTMGKVNLQTILLRLLGGLTSFGLTIFLVVVYAGFLMGEQSALAPKLAAAFPRGDQAERTAQILREVNRKIGDYLAVKTLINIILGAISFVILWGMGVDFALFWAVMIGLFNYIPYVGSIIGVALPILLSLAQFGSLGTTALLGGLLIAAQTYVGNILEPRIIGKQLNLSPFVVLVALSVWSALWGLPGAILAIPLTSMLTIICGSFPETRFVAVLLAGEAPEPGEGPSDAA